MLHTCLSNSCQQLNNNHTKQFFQSKLSTKHKKYVTHMSLDKNKKSRVGLIGLAVMGQNLALNIAEKGYDVSVYNRSTEKTIRTVKRALKEKLHHKLRGFHNFESFVHSLERPRAVIMLVQAGKPVDATIEKLCNYLEPGDLIIDGGNEWYENTERRESLLKERGL